MMLGMTQRSTEYLEVLSIGKNPTRVFCKDRPFVPEDVSCTIHIMNTPGFYPGYYKIQEVEDGAAVVWLPAGEPGATGGRGVLGGTIQFNRR